jgi:transposase
MGWFSDPSRRGGKRFPCQRGSFSGATGATALLYAPDLNPDEGIWKHLKCVELRNLCCESLSELKIELRKAKERLRHKRDVILGCIRQPGFEV